MMSPVTHKLRSWGGVESAPRLALSPSSVDELAKSLSLGLKPVLPVGNGRSYGDSALPLHGTVIHSSGLDRFIAFDDNSGELICEAGVLLADILATICHVSRNGYWFLPVSPGTSLVTVGGAIANDVHGKNHHAQGTFGCHVNWLDLIRTDGKVHRCSPESNADLFAATIGGMGLTGIIARASIRLKRVSAIDMHAENIRYSSLDEFFLLAEESCEKWEYTAAWLDCSAQGRKAGQGIFTRARHHDNQVLSPPNLYQRFSVPFRLPFSAINAITTPLFNYFNLRRFPRGRSNSRVSTYVPILYPLDLIGNWNRIYGKRGFYQFQCVLPPQNAAPGLIELISVISKSGQGSALSVLKTFGGIVSPGMMSFPRLGVTLALDFPNRGTITRKLIQQLNDLVSSNNGAIYPAKDAFMTAETYRRSYPRHAEFVCHIDPCFASIMSERLGITSIDESIIL